MAEINNIALLGSTGSIGTQTLDVVRCHPGRFKVRVLVAGSNWKLLAEQAREFLPDIVVIADETSYTELKDALAGLPINVLAGKNAVLDCMEYPPVDIVLTATVGYSGLEPTVRAIKARKDIALANKETLVVAGEYITRLITEYGVNIYPVDSEHSAIYQCLKGEDKKNIRHLIITASGGPFRNLDKSRLEHVTPKDALKHPNWTMGAKITIDSATMMNKAFEILEATWLFGVTVNQIKALVHPQSIVHSMVEFDDGSIKAQLGVPDMRLPIKYAMSRGNRLMAESQSQYLPFEKLSTLNFEEPDSDKFPCLTYAKLAATNGGTTACVINAANEIAVDAFLNERIKFTDIPRIIDSALDAMPFIPTPQFEDYIRINKETRDYSKGLIH